MSEDQKPEDAASNGVVFMTNIDMFAAHLTAWHSRKVGVLEHMLSIPEGTEITVNIQQTLDGEAEEKVVILTGDALIAFRGGIATALMELGTLPFNAVPVEDDMAEAKEVIDNIKASDVPPG